MPAEQFRGMTRRSKEDIAVKGRHRETRAGKSIRNWPATRTFNGKRYALHRVTTKKPTKQEISALKSQGYNVRVLSKPHPEYGYTYAVLTAPKIGKYAIVISPKAKSKKKKTSKQTKKNKNKKRTYQKGFTQRKKK